MLISPRQQQRYQQYYRTKRLPVPEKPPLWHVHVEALLGNGDEGWRRDWTVLDYGCGPQAALSRWAWYPVTNYDPGTLAYAALPEPADLLVCWHVLEHIEPECLDDVLVHIYTLAREVILCAVSCQPSTKVLPDGTPWHTIVQSSQWWQARLTAAWGVAPDADAGPRVPTEYRGRFAVGSTRSHGEMGNAIP